MASPCDTARHRIDAGVLVASLRESGLSIRAIAAATGLNKETVNNVTRELSGNRTPEPITGTDGKTYAPKPRPIVDQSADANNVSGTFRGPGEFLPLMPRPRRRPCSPIGVDGRYEQDL